MSGKQIIVCHEKHGEQYYDASTPELWAKSALAILTDRFNQGYWYYNPRTESNEREYDVIKQIVESQDDGFTTIGRGCWEREVPKAWLILEDRSDHEYERVELEQLR